MLACHAGDPGSIPGRRKFLSKNFWSYLDFTYRSKISVVID
ncbi:hypothetical protein T07_9924 [Trichinella nelsoni]|uniref:Uncharacterized protein n=1 Tax=Trichinella nelsoni TaxID=6336 RepID=A0A0V0RCN9_9BILA|nr:hypothetical protein T07_9924 [Trichinella nelsoni]